jgi:Flp pilus assembly protein TadG
MRRNVNLRRRNNGVSAIETAIAAFFLIVIVAIAVDLTVLTMGFTMLDTAARDAARGAGSQQTYAKAVSAAQSQLSIHQTDGVFIKQPTLTSTSSPHFVYQDFGGAAPPNPNQSPYVTVTCQTDIHLPVNTPFFGNDLKNLTAGGYFTIARRYTFPIVKAKYYGG